MRPQMRRKQRNKRIGGPVGGAQSPRDLPAHPAAPTLDSVIPVKYRGC